MPNKKLSDLTTLIEALEPSDFLTGINDSEVVDEDKGVKIPVSLADARFGGPAPVDSVFGRIGVVVAADEDYNATLITFTPDGDISATRVQAAIVEVRDDTDTKLALKLDLAGGTMTGLLQFSGTDHAGIDLNSLTTAQRDALTPSNGMMIYNSTDNQVQGYVNGSWGQIGGGGGLTLDTRANILATASPSSGDMFYATDTEEFLIYDGSDFQVQPLEFQVKSTTPDMGLQPPVVVNDLAGYSADYITDKLIAHSRIGANENTNEGDFRVSSSTFQIYLNGAWNDIVTGFRFREDSTGGYELEHKPIGFSNWYEIFSGNSDKLGINGLPITQQYEGSMGANAPYLRVTGRTFS